VVTRREFENRLRKRARRSGLAVPDHAIARLFDYFTLLARWNLKINLTALPLVPPADETFDRLFIEPIAAARFVDAAPGLWIDIGSGGGSPAIPLKIVRPALTLRMVESKSRKAAFLREVLRSVPMEDAQVLNARFEDLVADPQHHHSAALVTARAVRIDARLGNTANHLVGSSGALLVFHSEPRSPALAEFTAAPPNRLVEGSNSFLSIYRPVFHVEQQSD